MRFSVSRTPLLWLCLMLCAVGCSRNRVPNEVLPPDLMVDVMTDAYLIESFYDVKTSHHTHQLAADARASYDSLFARYGITYDDFTHSVDFYAHHLEWCDTIHQRTNRRLKALAADTSLSH